MWLQSLLLFSATRRRIFTVERLSSPISLAKGEVARCVAADVIQLTAERTSLTIVIAKPITCLPNLDAS